jgi:hypothetical protein
MTAQNSTSNPRPIPRSRWIAALGLLLVAGALAIRFAPQVVMQFLVTYGDDILASTAAYLFIGAACRRLAGWKALLLTLAVMWGMQVAELFHPAWIGPYWARLRFEWSDIASLAAGACLAFGVERFLVHLSRPAPL